jgi:hypothetical protein
MPANRQDMIISPAVRNGFTHDLAGMLFRDIRRHLDWFATQTGLKPPLDGVGPHHQVTIGRQHGPGSSLLSGLRSAIVAPVLKAANTIAGCTRIVISAAFHNRTARGEGALSSKKTRLLGEGRIGLISKLMHRKGGQYEEIDFCSMCHKPVE